MKLLLHHVVVEGCVLGRVQAHLLPAPPEILEGFAYLAVKPACPLCSFHLA